MRTAFLCVAFAACGSPSEPAIDGGSDIDAMEMGDAAPDAMPAFVPPCTDCTLRVSVATGGGQGDEGSYLPSVTTDGSVISFMSYATTLAPAGGNSNAKIFVRDMGAETTTRIAPPTEQPSNSSSTISVVSPDGRYVAFTTQESFVVGDDDDEFDGYLFDRVTHAIQLITVAPDPAKPMEITSMSDDARIIAFTVGEREQGSVRAKSAYVRDAIAQTTTRIAPPNVIPNGLVTDAVVSADGTEVVVTTNASNLGVTDLNATYDVYAFELASQTFEVLSVTTDGARGNSGSGRPRMSRDGQRVVFASLATNLVADDTNHRVDVFLRDRTTNTTTRVGATQGTSGNDVTGDVDISDDGRYVLFGTFFDNLVPGDTNNAYDLFLTDLTTTQTIRVSVGDQGQQIQGITPSDSRLAALSGNGHVVVFATAANNVIPGDTNQDSDVYVRYLP